MTSYFSASFLHVRRSPASPLNRGKTGDLPEYQGEIAGIVKSAARRDLRDAQLGIRQKDLCVFHANFILILYKIVAEGFPEQLG